MRNHLCYPFPLKAFHVPVETLLGKKTNLGISVNENTNAKPTTCVLVWKWRKWQGQENLVLKITQRKSSSPYQKGINSLTIFRLFKQLMKILWFT